MAIYKRKDRINTPFDDYASRMSTKVVESRETEEMKARYQTTRGALFLGLLILAITGNTFDLYSLGFVSISIVSSILIWLVSFRFIMNEKTVFVSAIVNLSLCISVSYLFEKYLTHYNNIFASVVLAMGLTILSSIPIEGEEILKTRAKSFDEVTKMILFAIVPSFVGVAFVYLIDVKVRFVSTIIAVVMLVIVSYILSMIFRKRYYMTSRRLKNFINIPTDPSKDIITFALSKTIVLISSVFTIACAITIQYMFGVDKYFEYALLPIMTIIMLVFVFFYRPCDRNSLFGGLLYPFEAMFIAYLLSILFEKASSQSPSLLLLNYLSVRPDYVILFVIAIIAGDIVITGLIATYRRKLLYTKRIKHFDGMPFMLLLSSFILMVVSMFFVIY